MDKRKCIKCNRVKVFPRRLQNSMLCSDCLIDGSGERKANPQDLTKAKAKEEV